MTRGEFLVYLLTHHRIGVDARFHGDMLLLSLITTWPLGYSIYEREAATE